MRNNLGQFAFTEKNPIEYVGEYALIWTLDKEGNKKQAYKVDVEDVEMLLELKWSVDTDGYAKHRSLKMHRVIMGAEKGQMIDHINRDKTDNRKENLRFVSHSLNMRNTNNSTSKTGVKHVGIMGNKFNVLVRCRGEKYYKGGFVTIEEAISYRDELHNKIKYYEE